MARSEKPKPPANSKQKAQRAATAKTKPKAAPKGKASVSRVNWTDVKGFLRDGWPTRVKATSDASVGARATESFRRWGLPVPKDLALFYAPLQKGAPALFERAVRSYAPELKAGNLAEQLLVAAQRYRPLWAEVFGACVEIGSTSNGDLWMYAFDPAVDHAPQIVLYAHESDELELASDGLGAAVLRSAVVTAHEEGDINDKGLTAATKALEKHVTNAWPFEERLHVADEAKTSDDDINQYCYGRARWLITLLTEDDASDAAIRGGFDVEMNSPLSLEMFDGREALFAAFPPAPFYYCLRAFFQGDAPVLDKALELAKASKAPLVKDLIVLMGALRKGQKKLGVISDVAALRKRVTALALGKPTTAQQATLPSPEAEAKAAVAERDGTLEELAWSAVGTDIGTLKAVVNRWAESERSASRRSGAEPCASRMGTSTKTCATRW